MQIDVKRRIFTDTTTLSDVFVDGKRECWILEDTTRPTGQKVFGKTAIPAGTYGVIINRSNRFSALAGHDVFLPLLLDVPGFAGVRIHTGNKPEDSEGCLLPGDTIQNHRIAPGTSRPAFVRLFNKIQLALQRKETVILTIG
jgi:hypothetical protein